MILMMHITWHGKSVQATPNAEAKALLVKQYEDVRLRLLRNNFGMPLELKSFDEGNELQGEVVGVLEHDFAFVKQELIQPIEWCNILLLHLNTKACVFETGSVPIIHLYSGRKFYQEPDPSKRLSFTFKVFSEDPDYLRVRLFSNDGPLWTKDYLMELEIIPLPKTNPLPEELNVGTNTNKTFFRFIFSYKMSRPSKAVIKLYLATLARSKVGFTIVGKKNDNPIYIKGVQGIIERNIIRYYLAIRARLDAISTELDFEQQCSEWFDATERCHLQLYEIEKKEYLQAKKKEFLNQRREQMKFRAF